MRFGKTVNAKDLQKTTVKPETNTYLISPGGF